MDTVKKQSIEEFVLRYLSSLDVSGAAELSGFDGDPAVTGMSLLSKRSAKRLIKKHCSNTTAQASALAALMKLAFGRCNDAVELLREEPPQDISSLDLYNVSEIKRVKGGGMEIKFFDRLEAIKMLTELCRAETGASGAESFFSALGMGSYSHDEDE